MKTFFALLLGLCGILTLVALAPSSPTTGAARSPEELDELFAPIALYPDALVALILPSTTVPADITAAANYLAGNGDPGQITGQPWNESVQSLAHYPEVMKWLNDNMPWTQQAGDAFLTQPSDVMKSIQQLRARAVAAGSLTSTPQQQVITDSDGIRIVPAQPDVIYVPRYDPDLVYEEQPSYGGPWLTFGDGYPEGVWLNYDLDWDNYGIWVGQWHRGWDYRHPAWRHGVGVGVVAGNGHDWRPPAGRRFVRPFAGNRGPAEIVHPKPFAGAPGRPAAGRGAPPAPGFRPSVVGPERPDLRGYPPANRERPIAARPAPGPAPTPAPPTSHVFGGYNRGSDARAASQRGQMSRQQSAPPPRLQVPAPAPRAAPPPPQQQQPPQQRGNPNDRKRN